MIKKIGIISHYFNHINVAALVLSAPLSVGDNITIKGHGKEFSQSIASMQINHQFVEKAKKGDDVAIKVDQPVKEDDEVIRL